MCSLTHPVWLHPSSRRPHPGPTRPEPLQPIDIFLSAQLPNVSLHKFSCSLSLSLSPFTVKPRAGPPLWPPLRRPPIAGLFFVSDLSVTFPFLYYMRERNLICPISCPIQPAHSDRLRTYSSGQRTQTDFAHTPPASPLRQTSYIPVQPAPATQAHTVPPQTSPGRETKRKTEKTRQRLMNILNM